MWYNNRDVRVEEMPVPKIGPGELLLRVEASGICGSDVMAFKAGDRVSAAHHVPCNTCYYCLRGHHTMCDTLRKTNFDPGGFAEYVRVPAINVDRGVFRLPDEMSYEDATFIEPLACVLRGQRVVNMQPGDSVLIIGSGIAGLLHLQLARTLGARRIIATDINQFRLDAAKRFGADVALHAREYTPANLREVNDGYLADLVIVCTGAAAATNQALQSVERGGTVLFFAPTDPGVSITVSLNEIFWRTDVTLTTSYGASPYDYQTALDIIRAGTVSVQQMITHRLPLTETGLGFQLVAEASDSIKVIIEPQK